MTTNLVNNVSFVNPTAGTDLTVWTGNGTNTATTKYLNIWICKKIQIRANKVFKVVQINNKIFANPSPSSSTNPEWKIDLTGTGGQIDKIVFQPEEASGEFQVLGISGVDEEA